jgi:hypothetical protein
MIAVNGQRQLVGLLMRSARGARHGRSSKIKARQRYGKPKQEIRYSEKN